MRVLIGVFFVALALALAGALAGPLVEGWQDSNAYQRQLLQLQLEQQATELRDYQQQLASTSASRAAASNLGYLGAGLGVVLALMFGTDYYRQRRQPLVKPDKFGQLPVSRAQITAGDFRQLAYQLAPELARIYQLEAIHQPGQTPAHLSQHIAHAPAALPSSPASAPAGLLPDSGQPEAAAIPSFAELLDRGRVGHNNPLLLGFDAATGAELNGTWKDLYSAAIAGVSGSGKTTTVRFLAAQSALHGARWVLLDPHADAGEDSLAGTLAPLASTFLCAPAVQHRAMLESVKLVNDELDRRLASRSAERWPLILAADEFTSLMRGDLAEPLAGLVEKIAQEGRKVLVFAMISGQIWTAERTGGSALRDSLASCYVHRMKRRQANHLLQLGDELPETLTLATGHALLYRTNGELVEVVVPNTSADDISRVATLLATPGHIDMPKSSQNVAYLKPGDMPTGSQSVANGDLATSAPASAEARRAAALFMEGADPAAIVLQLRGVRSSEGKRYQTALADVLELVRQGMRG